MPYLNRPSKGAETKHHLRGPASAEIELETFLNMLNGTDVAELDAVGGTCDDGAGRCLFGAGRFGLLDLLGLLGDPGFAGIGVDEFSRSSSDATGAECHGYVCMEGGC